jgi:hypothetical protein
MAGATPERTKVFISYSHRDAWALERLRVHLRPLERDGVLESWDDTRISTGRRWREEIREALAAAKVAVLLVSADFLASDFIADEELPRLLEAGEKEGLLVMPVVLKPSRFRRTPRISQFQAVNSADSPLVGMSETEQDAVWDKLTQEIEGALNHSPNVGAERRHKRDGVRESEPRGPDTEKKERRAERPRVHPTTWAVLVACVVVLAIAYWLSLKPPVEGEVVYVGRVTDAVTHKAIHGAKVSIEMNQKLPLVDPTDTEGVFNVRLPASIHEVRVRVDAEGYVPFDRKVSTSRLGLENIGLTPTPTPAPTSTPTPSRPAPAASGKRARRDSGGSTEHENPIIRKPH